MADLEKTIERMEASMQFNSIGLGKIVVQKDMLSDALELLKQYSGLAKALEQSNAVNEHLSAEIERLKAQLAEKKSLLAMGVQSVIVR